MPLQAARQTAVVDALMLKAADAPILRAEGVQMLKAADARAEDVPRLLETNADGYGAASCSWLWHSGVEPKGPSPSQTIQQITRYRAPLKQSVVWGLDFYLVGRSILLKDQPEHTPL